MSKYRDSWYPIVAKVAGNYPDYLAKKNAAQQQSVTAGYSGMPHSGKVSRNTEDAALRGLAPREETELDAVQATINAISRQRDGAEVIAVIRMVDFNKTHRLYGAADTLNMSYETAKRRRWRFMRLLAQNLGYKS